MRWKSLRSVLVGVGVFLGLMGIGGYIDTNYSRYGYVVDCSNGVATIEDTTGIFWEYEDLIEIGTYVKMSMHTNGTDKITDDIIKKIEKNPK